MIRVVMITAGRQLPVGSFASLKDAANYVAEAKRSGRQIFLFGWVGQQLTRSSRRCS